MGASTMGSSLIESFFSVSLTAGVTVVVVDTSQRGKGKGKEMLKLGLRYAFDVYDAKKVSLGVFANNEPAYYCYKAAGFKDVILDEIEIYKILDEEWKCNEMAIER